MKESNKARSTNKAIPVTLDIDTRSYYSAEAERGDFKRRKMTVFTGYAIFIAIMIIVML